MNEVEKFKKWSSRVSLIFFIVIIMLTIGYFITLSYYQDVVSIKAHIISTQALTIDSLKTQVNNIEHVVANINLAHLIFG